MESRFANDFSAVRVHVDSAAGQSARAVHSLAYTAGNDIAFASDHYQPATRAGVELLAHELAHVVQHQGSPIQTDAPLQLGSPSDPAEREASAAAKAVVSAHTPAVRPSASEPLLRRVPQEPTISEAKAKGQALPERSLSSMDVQTLAAMSGPDRRQWYISKLGQYENQLRESANNQVVPVQLLATVILNELADIDWKDRLQSELAVNKGSLGISQIQIDTAMKDNLFPDMTRAEEVAAYDRMKASLTPRSQPYAELMRTADKEKRQAINQRLQIPQQSIDAAAREVRILLDSMRRNLSKPWQQTLGFTNTGIPTPQSAQAIYHDIGGGTQKVKEQNLAELVTGAYNSPGIIAASDASATTFPNATTHGDNSRFIAGDLFDFGLFRPGGL